MVSEKDIKRLAAKSKKAITDRDLFTSKRLQRYFEELAGMLTQRFGYKLSVRVRLEWHEPRGGADPFVAYTDNATIVINTNNDLARECKTREDKLDVIKGLFAHELAHVLYTDFNIMRLFIEAIEVCSWYPEKPMFMDADLIANLTGIENYIRRKPENARRFYSVAKHIDNIIEDGYIEERFMQKYKGNLCEGLYLVREIHYDSMDPVWKLEEKTEADENSEEYLHPFLAEMQLLLSYAKFAEFKREDDDELEAKIVKALEPSLEFVDSALLSDNATFRRKHVNEVLVAMWPEIEAYLDWIDSRPETASEEASDSAGSGSGAVEKSLGSALKGESTRGSGKGKPLDSTPTSSEEAEKAREALKDAMKGEKSGKGEGGDEGSAEPSPTESGKGSGKNVEEAKEGEGGRIKEHETDSISEASDFSEDDPDYGESEEEPYEASETASARDIESILDAMATERAEESLEKERLKELSTSARELNYGEAHKGMQVDVRRITSVPDNLKEEYDKIAPELCKISKKLQRLIMQQLKDKRAGGKLHNLYLGRKLESRALIRDDGKSFYKKKLPQEAPQLCVGVLIDESGSMSWNNRVAYAKATAIVLYDFCRGLEIPCCVCGHTADETRYGSMQIHSYAEFDSIDKNDKYRLMDISARSNNRDGAALKYMYDKLSKRDEEVKLLIVISDGQPAASGYSGSSAERDMQTLKTTYDRRGIITFAAAIGSDKENIERIYKEGFLDITDLSKLPEILTKLILKYVRI